MTRKGSGGEEVDPKRESKEEERNYLEMVK
jgi:hypothetical protein